MPRPSLTEEIMGLVEQVIVEASHSGAGLGGDEESVASEIRTRLTSLETELEGYRKEKQTSVGRSEGGAVAAVCAGYPLAEGQASLRRRGIGDLIAQPSDLAVPHSIALPCESEYVNAQSDIQGEDLG